MGIARGMVLVAKNLRSVTDSVPLASDNHFDEKTFERNQLFHRWCDTRLAETGRPGKHHSAQVLRKA